MVGKEDDVCLVVPDLQRGAKVEWETTIQHYEDMLREAGVEGLKIVPFNQLRNEYKSFEMVRKLGSTYDYFLCDGRIMGQIAGFTGKVRYVMSFLVHISQTNKERTRLSLSDFEIRHLLNYFVSLSA